MLALTNAGLTASASSSVLAAYQYLKSYDVAITFSSTLLSGSQFEYDFTQIAGFGAATNQVANIAVVPEPTMLALVGLNAIAMRRCRTV